MTDVEVLIVGGGPAGLSAALALGRARRRVLVCDAGPRRNALATHLHNFVTRDGTPPPEFRAAAIEQLRAYPSVAHRAVGVRAIGGARGAFDVELTDGTRVAAARILLCTGMIDELPALPGFAALWGHAIFQCPYCHGWEARDRKWGYLALAPNPHLPMFALKLAGWTDAVTIFAGEDVLPAAERARLERAGLTVEPRPVARLVGEGAQLLAVEVADGTRVAIDTLFAHPPQRQVDLVRALGVGLDADGCVALDPMRQTSIPGIYAAGDLATKQQAAINAASTGTQTATMIMMDLMLARAA